MKKFLKSFFSKLRGSFRSEQRSEYQELARFILSDRHFSKTKGTVKPGAFLPAKDGNLSVFGVDGLDRKTIKKLGEQQVAEKQNKSLKGSGIVDKSVPEEQNLKVVVDNNPPRHVNITGWPVEKHEQKILALELAKMSRLETYE